MIAVDEKWAGGVESKPMPKPKEEGSPERTGSRALGVFYLVLSKAGACGHIVMTRYLFENDLFQKPVALAAARNMIMCVLLFFCSLAIVFHRSKGDSGTKEPLRKRVLARAGDIAGHFRSNGKCLFLASCCMFGIQTMVMLSLNLIPATNLATMAQLSPVFLFVISGLILRLEPATLPKLLGVVLAIAGALVVVDPTDFQWGDDKTAGNAMCVAIALVYAVFVLLQKRLVAGAPALVVMFAVTLLSSPMFAATGLATGAFQPTGGQGELESAGPDAEARGRAAVLGAIVVGACASVDYVFATASLRHVSPLAAGVANSILPAAVGAASYFVFEERLSWTAVLGCLLVISGMCAVLLGSRGDGAQQQRYEVLDEEGEEEGSETTDVELASVELEPAQEASGDEREDLHLVQ